MNPNEAFFGSFWVYWCRKRAVISHFELDGSLGFSCLLPKFTFCPKTVLQVVVFSFSCFMWVVVTSRGWLAQIFFSPINEGKTSLASRCKACCGESVDHILLPSLMLLGFYGRAFCHLFCDTDIQWYDFYQCSKKQ